MLALLNRVVSGKPEVYWSIQHSHIQAARVRERLAGAVQALDSAAYDSSSRMAELFEALRGILERAQPGLDDLTARAIELCRR